MSAKNARCFVAKGLIDYILFNVIMMIKGVVIEAVSGLELKIIHKGC